MAFNFVLFIEQKKNIIYNERKVFIMIPEILQYIAVIAFLGTLAALPCYAVYAGYKAIEQVKDLTKH